MSYGELQHQLNRIEEVCWYKQIELELELEWSFDDYYVNVWFEGEKIAEHLSSKGDFEQVWDWLKHHHPDIDWDEQEF